MNGPKFFETRMGAKFFEYTLPKLVDAINKLSDATRDAAKVTLRLVEAMEGNTNTGPLPLTLPCSECQKKEAIVSLPWNREQKVCAACWNELTDGTEIALADRIHRFPPEPLKPE